MAATRGTTTCMLSNYEELVKTLDNIAGVDAEKVIKKCTSDAKSRAQAWVSAAVCEVYAIKKTYTLPGGLRRQPPDRRGSRRYYQTGIHRAERNDGGEVFRQINGIA